jgi:hypothetical protein
VKFRDALLLDVAASLESFFRIFWIFMHRRLIRDGSLSGLSNIILVISIGYRRLRPINFVSCGEGIRISYQDGSISFRKRWLSCAKRTVDISKLK